MSTKAAGPGYHHTLECGINRPAPSSTLALKLIYTQKLSSIMLHGYFQNTNSGESLKPLSKQLLSAVLYPHPLTPELIKPLTFHEWLNRF